MLRVFSTSGGFASMIKQRLATIGHSTSHIRVKVGCGEETWIGSCPGRSIRVEGPEPVLSAHISTHLQRILDLLVEQPDNFDQIILMTHAHIWREAYGYEAIPQERCGKVELGGWSLEGGISTQGIDAALD